MNIRGSTAPDGARGVLVAVSAVLLICAAALVVGWGVSSLLAAAVDLPAWTILIFTVGALVPLMVIALRAMPWLISWYYLLPALVFLLTFTVYPIVLTINFAFTNYSAQNSGQPDSSTRIEVKRRSDRELTVTSGAITDLRCAAANCAGQPIVLRVEGETRNRGFTVASAQGSTIRLAGTLPVGLEPGEALKVNPIERIGFGNFSTIFANAGVQLWPVFVWTVVFAFSTVAINALAGLVLGILLNNKRLKFRNVYRTLLFLPWAVPAVISIQMWVALLNTNFGAINRFLGLFGALPVPWLEDPLWAKLSILLVNLWLGFPYMMTATLSALATIPDELYEAAEVDGASKWQQIRGITLPMLTAAFTPILLSAFAYNFNNFGIIYLLTAGGPSAPGQLPTARSTDILISWGYNTAFTSAGQSAYGPASAIAVLIAILTIGISVFNFRVAGVFKEARR